MSYHMVNPFNKLSIVLFLAIFLSILSFVFQATTYVDSCEAIKAQRDAILMSIFNILILAIDFRKGTAKFKIMFSILILLNLILISLNFPCTFNFSW